MGASPILLLVTSIVRVSSVFSSISICILRYSRRLGPPFARQSIAQQYLSGGLQAIYSPLHSALILVLSTSTCSGPVEPL